MAKSNIKKASGPEQAFDCLAVSEVRIFPFKEEKVFVCFGYFRQFTFDNTVRIGNNKAFHCLTEHFFQFHNGQGF